MNGRGTESDSGNNRKNGTFPFSAFIRDSTNENGKYGTYCEN
jgi:hypothetical protein